MVEGWKGYPAVQIGMEEQIEVSHFKRVSTQSKDWPAIRLEDILTRDFTVNSLMYDARWPPLIHHPPPPVRFADYPGLLRSVILSLHFASFI